MKFLHIRIHLSLLLPDLQINQALYAESHYLGKQPRHKEPQQLGCEFFSHDSCTVNSSTFRISWTTNITFLFQLLSMLHKSWRIEMHMKHASAVTITWDLRKPVPTVIVNPR